jgi:hypothetical protein
MSIEEKIEKLMRKGDILNVVGLFRAAHIFDDKITRNQFKRLVKRNYMIKKLSKSMLKQIDEIWMECKEILHEHIKEFTLDEIHFYNPMHKFFEVD